PEAVVGQLERLPAAEGGQAARQLLRARHRGASDAHRYHADGACARRLDLDSRPVLGIVQAPVAVGVRGVQPLGPDEGEQHVARPDSLLQSLHEVVAGLDLPVHAHLLLAEVGAEAVVETAGVGSGVAAPVADEDVRHRPQPPDWTLAEGARCSDRTAARSRTKETPWPQKARPSPTTTTRWSPTSTRRRWSSITTSTIRPTWTRST